MKNFNVLFLISTHYEKIVFIRNYGFRFVKVFAINKR